MVVNKKSVKDVDEGRFYERVFFNICYKGIKIDHGLLSVYAFLRRFCQEFCGLWLQGVG